MPLTGFERLLFRIAVVLGATLILFRLAAMVLLPYLRHAH